MAYPLATARKPIPSYIHSKSHEGTSLSALKKLIWIYLFLLIFEGAFRKWLIPSLADPLLIVRDPIVFLIYFLAIQKGRFPFNTFMAILTVLAFFSLTCSLLSENPHIFVILYGIRTAFLHIPLIFIMPLVLNREDINKIGNFLLWSAVGMTALIILQFFSPPESFINRLTGGNIGGIIGAKGRFRPPGTFSFITGLCAFYPLVTAFLIDNFLGHRRFKWFILAIFSAAVVMAIPFSISRQTALTTGLVVIFSVLAAWLTGSNTRYIIRLSIGLVLTGTIIFISPFFSEGVSTFMDRWSTSTGEEQGGIQGALVNRYLGDLGIAFTAMEYTPFFGYGLGMGTNVGSKLLTGEVNFLLSESEWGRIIMEMGPLLGWLFIFFRISIVIYMWSVAFRATRKNQDPLPILFFAAALPLMLNGQWGPPTTLGFAVFASGLCLASAIHPPLPLHAKPPVIQRAYPAYRQFRGR